EPAARGDDVARVHVHRRHQGRLHVGDERDAARPEAGVLRRARYLAAELLGEFAVHGRDVDADLLENAAAHDRHDAAATARPLPRPALEAAGAAIGEARGVGAFELVLEAL